MDPKEQDQMMQQVAQTVQQMVDQGMQPADIAGQLLQQVPPEALMQIFVQLGLPEDQAQQAIQQAMQGAQQGQDQGQAPVDPNQQQSAQEEQAEGASSNPQEEAVEQPMMMFGGNMRRLMKKSFGGSTPLDETSENYPAERLAMFVNAVKKNTMMNALEESLPTFSNSLPKAAEGFEVVNPADGKRYKLTDELLKQHSKGDSYDWGALSSYEIPNTPIVTDTNKSGTGLGNQAGTQSGSTGTSVRNGIVYDQNGNAVGMAFNGNNQQNWNYNQGQQGNFPVGYGFNNQPNVAPIFRIFGNQQGYGNPRITGNNMPQGADAYAFMRQAFSQGPTGKFGDQDYRITGVEDIKGGLFGRKKVGTRYHIDWGAGANGANAGANNTQNATNFTDPSKDVYGKPLTDEEIMYADSWSRQQDKNKQTDYENNINPDNLSATNPNMQPNWQNQTGQGIPKDLMDQFSGNVNQPMQINTPVNRTVDFGSNELANPVVFNPIVQSPQVVNTMNPNAPATSAEDLMNMMTKPTPDYASTPQTVSAEEQLGFDNRDRQEAQTPIVNRSGASSATTGPLKNGQDADYYTAYLSQYQTIPWDTPQEKDYFKAIELRNQAEKNKKASNVKSSNNAKEIQRQKWLANEEAKRQAATQAARNSSYQFAFGGDLPRAEFGLDIALSDNSTTMEQYNSNPEVKAMVDKYLVNLNQNSAAAQSAIDMQNQKRLTIDFGAVGDTVMNTGNRYANFMDKVRGYNPERENALYSSMNRQSRTFDQMDQGLYHPDGQLFPNQMGNQVLNNTDTYGAQQMSAFAMGGEYDLNDDELDQLSKAGFKFKRM